jgi:hypothetical protein
VELPRIRFRHTWVFDTDGATLTSDSTLRFRDREQVTDSLAEHGFPVLDVGDAPDRPGQRWSSSRADEFSVRRPS